MFSRKKNSEQDSHQEERYQFMREQVKPQKRKRLIAVGKRFGVVAVSACLFGGIAGAVILFIQDRYGQPAEKIVEISTYATSTSPTCSPDEDTKSSQSDKKSLTLEGLNRMTERLATVGTVANASIVGVKSKGNAQNWFADDKNSGQKIAFGLIFEETENYYYVLTVCDIIKEQPSVDIQLIDDTIVSGKILGSDAQLNLAVLSVKKGDIATSVKSRMAVANLGKGNTLTKGSNVVAIGCPNGVLESVVTGVITNDTISASITDGEIQLFSTNMQFSSTSSGVVLDTEGLVVGMISTNFTQETGATGLSFIDISDISTGMKLLQHKQSIAYLGVEGKSINATIAEAHNLEIGAYITDVYSQAPAYVAGMRVADVITKVDGEGITCMKDVYNMLLRHKKGDTVTCTVSRKSGKNKVTKNLKINLQ